MAATARIQTDRPANILVVEDSPSWQKKFKRFLRDEPFRVKIAANYQEAVENFDASALDLLILDVNLSGVPYNVDGLTAAHQLWRQNNALKIIIISGDAGWEKRLAAYQFVPNYILKKQNLDHNDLVEKIYQVLSE